ncbi:hypothetical protein XF36_13030 [Pseudonocardia sp. HH130629-09]|nr:hypothetical protein XF36_13030 [Pseudonocardia sp. HH130629-09]
MASAADRARAHRDPECGELSSLGFLPLLQSRGAGIVLGHYRFVPSVALALPTPVSTSTTWTCHHRARSRASADTPSSSPSPATEKDEPARGASNLATASRWVMDMTDVAPVGPSSRTDVPDSPTTL